ncbi:MAG: SH3 domain-containing C40 family peptidase [Clostridiales bacterium]|nr:SH3 domain-containing C40 family peptidase [Clostridiales bacterium]
MRNFKHSIVAVIAIAMISSLATVQGSDIIKQKNERQQALNAAAQHSGITITQKDVTEGVKGVALENNEAEQAQAQAAIENNDKSSYQLGYVEISAGTLPIQAQPSDESERLGELNACDQVEILESTEGYYKVASEAGTGYVLSEAITDNKSDAEYAAMQYDHYKEAKVTSFGSGVNVRSSASTDADIVNTLADTSDIVVLGGEGDFVKIAYGNDMDEGYIINTSVDFTGEWIEKDEVQKTQQKAQERREAARRAEAAAKANSSAGGYSTLSKTESGSSSVSSSGGQAIVDTAMQYLGVPYVWGGTSPSGFDCSGLVQYVCAKNGIKVNRVAADQRNNGTYVSRENLAPGDLVFFGGSGGIHHVGIYVGNGQMIHAPQTGDVVKISSIETDYRISTYAGAVRVTN